jgi:hypothetical protein
MIENQDLEIKTPTPSEDIGSTIDPLFLDLDNSEFSKAIDDNLKESIQFYKNKDLYLRQQRNEDALFGRRKPKGYDKSHFVYEYNENIIYEAIGRIKPIALSRMPDLFVKAGNNNQQSKKNADDLTKIINSDIKKRENRQVLGMAHRQEQVYFFSVIKARWNPELGLFGDYEFINVHPDNVIFDHKCTTSNVDDMRFFSEKADLTVKEVIMMFPDVEDKLKAYLAWDEDERSSQDKLATSIEIRETWFHWYKEAGEDEGTKQWERVEGVVWKHKDLILGKMKNPYFDYQGEKRLFKKELEERREISENEIFDLIDFEKGNYEVKQIFHNFFQQPRKPYFLMVYEPWGKHPINETTRVEQAIPFQDAINIEGNQILDMNIRSRGKDIFDTEAIDQETIDNLDMYSIDQALGISAGGLGLNRVHARIEQPPASAQMYNSKNEQRSMAFELLGVNATTRGVREGDSTLGESQMMREADYGMIDDVVEETINAAALWMAQWSMQFIKLFYTKPYLKAILGKSGSAVYLSLTRDVVDDGMDIEVAASGVDKLRRKRMAVENMKLGIGDPLSYYEDTEQSNPKERALRAMLVQSAPQMYMQQYLMDNEGVENQAEIMQSQLPDQPQQQQSM